MVSRRQVTGLVPDPDAHTHLSIGRSTRGEQVPVFGGEGDPFDRGVGVVAEETGTALLLHLCGQR